MLKIAITCFLQFFDENHLKREVNEKGKKGKREKDTSPGEKLSVNREFKIEEMRNTDVVKLDRK